MEFTITQKESFLYVDVSSEMTPSDLLALYEANEHTNANRLFDLSQADVDIHLLEFQGFLDHLVKSDHNQRDSYKVAVLFDSKVERGFAHVVQSAQSQALNNPIRVFFDKAEAEQWLTPAPKKKKWFQKFQR